MEELIVISLILLSLAIIYCFDKVFQKQGLYYALVLLNLISFVLTFKIAYILRTNINIGIIPLLASFAIIYIYIVRYGNKEKNNIISISIYSNITFAILLAIMNFCIPTLTETISINIKATFETNYKILILYPIIVLISQYAITKMYILVSKIQNNIFLSVILTYIITALIYTIIFILFAYIKVLTIKDSIFVGVSTYIFGLIINLLITIFIYYVTKKKVKKWQIYY